MNKTDKIEITFEQLSKCCGHHVGIMCVKGRRFNSAPNHKCQKDLCPILNALSNEENITLEQTPDEIENEMVEKHGIDYFKFKDFHEECGDR